jgi:hypothetical protein
MVTGQVGVHIPTNYLFVERVYFDCIGEKNSEIITGSTN